MTADDRNAIDSIRALLRAGDPAGAARRCEAVLARDPGNADCQRLLGFVYRQQGRADAAARQFAQAIALNDGDIAALNELGNIHWEQGRVPEAAGYYRRVLAIAPATPGVLVNLGNALVLLGSPADAAAAYEQAQALQPDSLEARFGLASALTALGHGERAVTLLEAIGTVRPDYPGLQLGLGQALQKLGRRAGALACFDRAIAAHPDDYRAHNSRGNTLSSLQRHAEALASFRAALAIRPEHAGAHSNLLLTMNYTDESQAAIYAESVRFGARHEPALATGEPAFRNSREPQRVLRVGYVSADFRQHSVAHFLRHVLAAHDRGRVQVCCYSNVERPDAVTTEFEAIADVWRPVRGLTDAGVADLVRADGIDILVDLGGHTGGNRLLVFARRPAPVQLSWLGYPNTSGLRAIDYRLTDAIADPPGEADALHTEKLVRLPGGFLCYRPGAGAPDSTARVPDDPLTFGSFNTLAKLTPGVIRVWAEILSRLPPSRLLLKSDGLNDAESRARLTDAFAAHGIAPGRIALVPWIEDYGQHLALYSGVDVALDPFPYNGTTTTCEALWMGVPVITLRGDRHAGRVGASILHHAGLGEWLAEGEEEYVRLAIASVADRRRLAAQRASIAARVRTSPLADTARFTSGLESACRAMWVAWCDAYNP